MWTPLLNTPAMTHADLTGSLKMSMHAGITKRRLMSITIRQQFEINNAASAAANQNHRQSLWYENGGHNTSSKRQRVGLVRFVKTLACSTCLYQERQSTHECSQAELMVYGRKNQNYSLDQ